MFLIEVIAQTWKNLSPTWKCLVILAVIWRILLEFLKPSSLRSILWQLLCLTIGFGAGTMIRLILSRKKKPRGWNGPTTEERKTGVGHPEP